MLKEHCSSRRLVSLVGKLIFPIACLHCVHVVADEAEQPAAPIFVMQFKSADDLRAAASYLVSLFEGDDSLPGLPEPAKKLLVGPKALQGIDRKKPVMVFADSVDGNNLQFRAAVPLANANDFLSMLTDLGIPPEKDEGGIYSIKSEDFLGMGVSHSMIFTIERDYLWMAGSQKELLATDRLPSLKALVDGKADSLVVARLNVEKLPEKFRNDAWQDFKGQLAGIAEMQSDDTLNQLCLAMVNAYADALAAMLDDVQTITMRFNVVPESDDIALELDIVSKSGSQLSQWTAGLAEKPATFGGIARERDAAHLSASLNLPEPQRKVLAKRVREIMERAVAASETEEEQARTQLYLQPWANMFKSGRIDAAVSLRAPNAENQHTVVAGLAMSEARSLDNWLRDILEKSERIDPSSNITREVDKTNGLNIYKFRAVKEVLPNLPTGHLEGRSYFVFAKEGVLFANGEDGQREIKSWAASRRNERTPTALSFACSHSQYLLGETDVASFDRKMNKAYGGRGRGNDTLIFKMAGGSRLNCSMSIKGKVITAFTTPEGND